MKSKNLQFEFSKNYENATVSAQGSMTFGESSWIVAIMGESGAGKTTLARWLAGLLEQTTGLLKFDDEVWCDSSKNIFISPQSRRIGYLGQGDFLFPHLTVEENIAYGLRLSSKTERQVRVAALLQLIGLKDFAQRKPGTLSGGQRRRVALAQTLAIKPRILFLDEPLTGLDHATKGTLLQDLKVWLETFSIPAVIITHDLNEARALTDRVHTFENRVLRI